MNRVKIVSVNIDRVSVYDSMIGVYDPSLSNQEVAQMAAEKWFEGDEVEVRSTGGKWFGYRLKLQGKW